MGTDDQRYKFGSDADPNRWVEADWIQIGAIYQAETSSFLRYVYPDNGGFYKPFLLNTPIGTWDFYVRGTGNVFGSNDLYNLAFIRLSDGYYYVVGIKSISPSSVRMGYSRTTTRPTEAYQTLTTIIMDFPDNDPDNIFGLRFYSNGDVDIIKGIFNPGDPWNPTFSVLEADIYTEVFADKTTEVGFISHMNSSSNTLLHRIVVEGDLPTPLGGDATLENPISIIARTSIGSMGVANMDFIEKDLASKISTIISNHRKSVTINESSNGIPIMIGEIIQTPHQLTRYSYRVEEISRKLLRTPALTDPIKESGIIRHIGKDPVTSTKTIIDDRDKDFTVNVNVNDLVNFTQETTDQLKSTPDFAGITWLSEDFPPGTYTPFIPVGTTGNISNCYFDDKTIAVADNQIGAEWDISDDGQERSGIVVFFYFPIKVGNSPTKLTFKLTVAFRKLSRLLSVSYPIFQIYDYNAADYEQQYQLVAGDVGGKSSIKDDDDTFGYEESTNAEITFTIDTNTSNYIDQITGNSGADEFNRFEAKLFIQQFIPTSIGKDVTIHLYKAEMIIDLASEQDGLLELGKVGSVAATRLDFQDLQGRQPFMDGISNDDKYFVLDLAEVMLGNALVNSGLDANFTLDIDATGMSTLAIIQDFTDRSFWDLLQFVCTSLNAFWYINPSTKAITIRTTDKIEDTGIELDDTDIYNFHDQIFNNNIDSSNLRTKIKVIGDKVDSGNVSISPEFGSTFGNETEIIDRADAETVTEVSDIANSQKVRHAKANRLMTFPINTTVNSKNLSALAIGKLITVKIPADGSLINYSGDNKILIYAMDYEKTERTAQEEIIYLQLQRRY